MTDPTVDGLEVVTRRPAEAARPHPLLFVHGGYAGAWCWDEHFLPWFAARGYPAHALSLRGHGGSDGHDALDGFGVEDYVEDLAAVVEALGASPILVGHSMGGYVVQQYLQGGSAAAAVLMAAVPPTGLAGPGLSLAVWDPAAAFTIGSLQTFGDVPDSTAAMRQALFSERLPPDRADALLARMGRESSRAMMQMLGGGLIWARTEISVPVLVMGAAEDRLIQPAFVRSTARCFGVRPRVLDDIGHLMMLDAEWEAAASSLLDWMRANAL